MAQKYDMPVIYSTHPRSKKFIERRGFIFDKRVQSLKPFNFTDYNKLQLNAYCVVSDSGTLPEESAYFLSKGMPFPAVCIRTSTERPEALDAGTVKLVGTDYDAIVGSVSTLLDNPEVYQQMSKAVNPYGDGQACRRIVQALK